VVGIETPSHRQVRVSLSKKLDAGLRQYFKGEQGEILWSGLIGDQIYSAVQIGDETSPTKINTSTFMISGHGNHDGLVRGAVIMTDQGQVLDVALLKIDKTCVERCAAPNVEYLVSRRGNKFQDRLRRWGDMYGKHSTVEYSSLNSR
jgi:hypothetical protein